MSLASCICTLTSICHVAAVTEGQSRGHQHKKSMSPSAAPQTGTDVVFVEELHDGLEIRFVDAVCGTQQADSRLARWTSSVAPQHPSTQAPTAPTACKSRREVLCLDSGKRVLIHKPCVGWMDGMRPALLQLRYAALALSCVNTSMTVL